MHRTSKILEQTSGNLAKMISKAKSYAELQARISRFLDADIKICSIEDQHIHLQVTSALIATQIRYRQRNLLEFLEQSNSGTRLTRVKISVAPETDESHEKTGVARQLSADSKSLIIATADCIEDSELKQALERFAEHH
jgi:hypothetical protein